MSDAPVLVTGAGGFIGGAVVRRLLAHGKPVRAGLRRLPVPGNLGAGAAATPVRCDLADPASLGPALAGAGAIVHAAVGATDRMTAELATLLAAAEAARIDRIVHLSSIAVYGDRGGTVTEEMPESGPAEPYGEAKRACERMLRDWARQAEAGRHRAAVLLRPGIVYGPGSRLWIDRPLACLRAGTLGRLGPAGDGIAALVHVDDVAEAVRLALAGLAGPRFTDLALNIAGPGGPSWNAYLEALARAAGLPVRTIGAGRFAALQALSRPAKVLARLGLPSPAGLSNFPAPGELRLFRRRAIYDAGLAQATIGWRPRIALDQGLADSLPPASTT